MHESILYLLYALILEQLQDITENIVSTPGQNW